MMNDNMDQATWGRLIARLRIWFAENTTLAFERQVITVAQSDGTEASLLIMPAWNADSAIGVKVVTFFPGNSRDGRATINAGYLLFNNEHGALTEVLDGDDLTLRRTAAVSALASSYLSRPGSSNLLVVGTGQLSAPVTAAHCSVRPIASISVWGRDAVKARKVAANLNRIGLPAKATDDLERACRNADIVSTVTSATSPLIFGDWLRPDSHLDLIGSFRDDMRECDSQAIGQADLFVDNRASALLSGDLAKPIAEGVITAGRIQADLAELCQDQYCDWIRGDRPTVFKSAGSALADLATATFSATGKNGGSADLNS